MNRIKEGIAIYNQKRPSGEKKMTQKKLAEKIFCDDKEMTISSKEQLLVWCIQERRKMHLVAIRRMCDALNLSADFLLGR